MTVPERVLRRQAELVTATLDFVRDAVAAGHPADATLARLYREHPEYGSRDRRLLSDTIFAAFRWAGWLTPERAPDTATACRLAVLLDGAELPPALDLMAPAAIRDAARCGAWKGLDLEAKAASLAALTATETPAISDLLPPGMLDLIPVPDSASAAAFGRRLIEAFQTSPPTWLRVEPSGIARVVTALTEGGMHPVTHPILPCAAQVPRGAHLKGLPRDITQCIDVQDLASQAVGLVCAPRAGERWWDVCAGSGGKSLHLASLMGYRGHLLATDIRESALDAFRRRVTAPARQMIDLRRWNGLEDAPPAETFDGILLDAPCSGVGTWHRNPDARWRLPERRIRELACLQSSLLDACASRLRPGGSMVYATCTLIGAENLDTIRSFLGRHPDFAPAPLVNPLGHSSHAGGTVTIYPWVGPCNGMFLARLVRVRNG